MSNSTLLSHSTKLNLLTTKHISVLQPKNTTTSVFHLRWLHWARPSHKEIKATKYLQYYLFLRLHFYSLIEKIYPITSSIRKIISFHTKKKKKCISKTLLLFSNRQNISNYFFNKKNYFIPYLKNNNNLNIIKKKKKKAFSSTPRKPIMEIKFQIRVRVKF